jgi:phenylpropionate dioxygenase-like ring-hydroxylating dioxygenase large terminal subunit
MALTRHFHPVVRASKLRGKPVRVELDGTGYALWRDATGTPRAVRDQCAHRHAPLSAGRVRPDGRLACGYHGWHFDGDGNGVSPAVHDMKCSVAAMQVVEELGWLWLAARDASSALPAFAATGWRFVGSYALDAPAPLHVVVDNFSENEHTPYVHGRLGYREEDAPRVTVETRCLPDRTEVTYTAPQRPSALLPLVLVENGDVLENTWTTRFSPIHSIYELSWRDPATGKRRPFGIRVGIVFVPRSERSTHIVSFLFTRLEGRHLIPRRILDAAAYAMGWKEVWDDARWVRHVADTQRGFEGMRLTRFDKPLAHNRKLADALYHGEDIVSLRARR